MQLIQIKSSVLTVSLLLEENSKALQGKINKHIKRNSSLFVGLLVAIKRSCHLHPGPRFKL